MTALGLFVNIFFKKDPHLNAVESAADAVAVDPNVIKTLLPNDLITFFINGKPVFSDGPRTLPRNPLNWIILDNWVFDNLISVDKIFAKVLQRFAACLLVNNDLC